MQKAMCWMGCLLFTVLTAGAQEALELPAADAQKLPRWRGFNLLEKFHIDWSNGPFIEEDFKLISELGFNFVRLPMDYRTWIVEDDWHQLNETVLADIDQAVAWGQQYNIHVCINFHRAPGYTVAQPPEPTNLWTDAETLDVCAKHWAAFARRYRGIPNERLSFNLMNEPGVIDTESYVKVVQRLVEAIRQEDPDRLIICDGVEWGRKPCIELASLGVAQATRGYEPMGLTHYLASWVFADQAMSMPTWPMMNAPGYLYGPFKPDSQAPITIEGAFAGTLRLQIGEVSSLSQLEVRANDAVIWTKRFECGPGEGEWEKAEYQAEWDHYKNIYNRDYLIEIPEGTQRIDVNNIEGDWLYITEIGLQPENGPEAILGMTREWEEPAGTVRIEGSGTSLRLVTEIQQNQAWLREHAIQPWNEWKGGVMVGEWGSYNKTPHDVTLRWMEDCLRNWQEKGWGWAMWNFRGDFGILDSGREDVDYEEWNGHKLDRKMLNLIQQY